MDYQYSRYGKKENNNLLAAELNILVLAGPCGPSFLSPIAVAIAIAMAILSPGNLHAALTESGSAVDGGSPGPAHWILGR